MLVEFLDRFERRFYNAFRRKKHLKVSDNNFLSLRGRLIPIKKPAGVEYSSRFRLGTGVTG